jgi:hypothetical protein
MWKERAGGGFDQVASAEQVSRPLLPAPTVKGQRSRHSGEEAAPGCGGAAVEQAGGTEDERAGADRGDTKRIEPPPLQDRRAGPGSFLAPEVVHDAQVAWNALARLEFQMDTVQTGAAGGAGTGPCRR